MVKVFAAEFNKIPPQLLSDDTGAPEDSEIVTVLPSRNTLRKQIWRAGRLVLRHGLKQVLHQEPGPVNLKYNPYGKPYLVDYPEIFFNLSHSDNWIVCAISDREIGIDVEQIRDISCMPAIVEKMFSPSERMQVMDLEGFAGLDMFFSVWTLKESFVKYLGRGFSLPFHTFSISESAGEYQVTWAKKDNDCKFQLWDKPPGYKIALCCEESVLDVALVILHADAWAAFGKQDFSG